MANLSLSTIDQPAYQRAGGNLQPRSCGVRGRVLRTGTRPADRGDSPWTTPPRCPPPAPTRAPLAHELHKINNKFSMKRKNRKTRPFNLPLTSSSVALVQHFQHRQNKVPTTSPDRKTDSPPNSSVQAHVLIGKRSADLRAERHSQRRPWGLHLSAPDPVRPPPRPHFRSNWYRSRTLRPRRTGAAAARIYRKGAPWCRRPCP